MHSGSARKKVSAFFIGIIISTLIAAQSVGINTTTPHASAILEIKSSTKGMLIPRTSTSSRIGIGSPAKGLIIYDTTTSSIWFYNGGAWTVIASSNNTWDLSGNTAINPVNHFIGTKDAQPLRFRINNSWAGELHPTSGNVFLGVGSGQANTIGAANTAIGEHSLLVNTTGSFNTAAGYEALSANTTGYNNTAKGGYALTNNTTGFNNTAVGRNALFANSTGNFNTAVGVGALLTNTAGDANTASGYNALYSNTTGTYNTADGYIALTNNTTGFSNTATGGGSLYLNTTGYRNTAIGTSTLSNNTTGAYNTAMGVDALISNTQGTYNTAAGDGALFSNTIGYQNTAIGSRALYLNNNGLYNTAVGVDALSKNTSGTGNDGYGHTALGSNTTGNFNIAFGISSLLNNTTGSSNIAIGSLSLVNNTTGQGNISIGHSAGSHPNAPAIYNTISIGNNDILNGFQNQVIIGNTSTGFIGGKVSWSVVSDARIKNTVMEDVKGLDFILRLRPVTYHISNKAMTTVTGNKETPDFPGKYDTEKIKYTGFIAQEVEQAAKSSGYDFSGYAAPKNEWGLYTVSYEQFVVPLVKAMQEQQSVITNQQKQINGLEKRLAALEATTK